MRHNYWACALEPGSRNCWAHTPQPLKAARPGTCAPHKWETHTPQLEEPPLAATGENPHKWETHTPQLEKSPHLLQVDKQPMQQETQYNQK